jgi:hypothetical protein
MNAVPAPAFPGSRVLAGWWRQLAPAGAQGVWVGHLALHHVEALVELTRPRRPDPFTLLVLDALRLEQTRQPEGPPGAPAATTLRLDERLHLGRPLLRQVLRTLQGEGLVREGGPGGWALTPLGEQALARGEYPLRTQERRDFHFVQPREPAPEALPHFLNLNSHSSVPTPVSEEWEFDPTALRTCLARPPEWKQRYGFPADVSAVIGPAVGEESAAWRQVIVDRPERLLAVLVRVGGEGEPDRLLGFAAQQEGWALQADAPAFTVAGRWDELFPELGAGPPAEAWREAWLAWCQPRGIPTAEAAACSLELHGERLRVRAPGRLIERLEAARSDAIKGEAWLLAGEGVIRRAAVLEVVELSRG